MNGDNNQNHVGNIQNPSDLTHEQKVNLTLWAEELKSFGLTSCLEVYNKQAVVGKMILFFEFKSQISNKVLDVFRMSVQEHFMNVDQVQDYLGLRLDHNMVIIELERLDKTYTQRFEKKICCDLGFGLIRDDDEITTEEYDTSPEECETLNDF